MLGESHNLLSELPEYVEQIHTLKLSNQHFARLYDEYDEINHLVCRLEEEGSPVADESLEEMKKTRLKLKDELYAMIVAS